MTGNEEVAHLLATMGPRLKAARARDGRGLGEVCRATGLTPSTLSRMENGHRHPTLEVLLLLAREYRVPLDELAGTAPARPAPLRGADDKAVLPLTRYVGGLHAHKHVLPATAAAATATTADAPPPRPRQVSHPGHEWLCVLSGRLRLALGDRELVLAAGEVAEFDTRTPHGVANAAPDRPVEYLVMFGPQGERLRVRD
ncbi:helix-turn-helix domain-containing protein [Kitasatospora fiedleri]|uniref:helix-turn-helix domain-containing protein n=1 Tax=Kitasatospora fiedleri TaxID=2991545 RepID=UPI00249CB038|nr:helix-turn-helix domain-containing protein [Kitasatospora fiedleri]